MDGLLWYVWIYDDDDDDEKLFGKGEERINCGIFFFCGQVEIMPAGEWICSMVTCGK